MITNCILWGDSAPYGPEIMVGTSSILSVSYSDVQGGEGAANVSPDSTLKWLDGNINENPLFVGGGDYYLSAISPCIDAGNPDPSYNDECFPPSLGTERNDMGAYGGPGACAWQQLWYEFLWLLWCDSDLDGFLKELCGGDDCDDGNPGVHPVAEELCDEIDWDCSGDPFDRDGDGDGFIGDDAVCMGDDCDDSDPETYPRCSGDLRRKGQ